ncbi:MAG: hypothetical protein ACFFAQ_05720 [Promethearchaeota archaeon]
MHEALNYYEKLLEIDPKFPYAVQIRNHVLSNLDDLKRSSVISHQRRSIEQLKSWQIFISFGINNCSEI